VQYLTATGAVIDSAKSILQPGSVTDSSRPGTTGAPSGTIQEIEAKVPGIGGLLVKLTQGWDNLAAWEKTAIIAVVTAAIVLFGWEAVLALAGRLGVGAALSQIGHLFGHGAHDGRMGHMAGVVPMGFTPAWIANGVQFYRNEHGLLGVMNHKGRWKQWRPRKPIVLFAGGAKNLKTMLKADRVLKKQARELSAMIERRAGRREPREQKIPISEAVRLIEGERRR
jgi:hypothetical protein